MNTLSIRAFSPMRAISVLLALSLIALAAVFAGRALAASGNYNVNASGGYANTLTFTNPSWEIVKGWHTAGTPYQFKLHRFSDGAWWGPWTATDLGYYGIPGHLSGAITAQIDNQGTANPAAYYVEMF